MKKLLILLIFVLLLLGGGFIFLRIGKEGSDESSVPSNWETFANSQHGLTFQYPPDWKLEVTSDKSDFLAVNLNKEDNEQEKIETYGEEMLPKYTLSVTVATNPKKLSTKEFHLEQFSESSRVAEEGKIKSITVDDLQGIRYTEGAAPSSGLATGVLVTKEDKVYRFVYMAMATRETHEKFLAVLDDLVSTVEFE